jgi:hypothetical protein
VCLARTPAYAYGALYTPPPPQIRWSPKCHFSVFCMIPSEKGSVFGEFWYVTSKKIFKKVVLPMELGRPSFKINFQHRRPAAILSLLSTGEDITYEIILQIKSFPQPLSDESMRPVRHSHAALTPPGILRRGITECIIPKDTERRRLQKRGGMTRRCSSGGDSPQLTSGFPTIIYTNSNAFIFPP